MLNEHNTVFTQSGQLSVHKLVTSCIRRCVVSRVCDWVMSALSAALLIFSFQFSLFFPYIGRQAAQALRLLVLISYDKIFIILFRKFTWRHQLTLLCFQMSQNLYDGKSVKSCVIYLTKNFSCLSNSLLRGSRPKSARASPQQCVHSAPDVIQIGSISAEFSRMR